jgi:hypothetical protein
MLCVSDKVIRIDNYGNHLCRDFPYINKTQVLFTAKQFFPLPYLINKYVDFKT